MFIFVVLLISSLLRGKKRKKKKILEAEENPFQKSWNKKLGPYILGETSFCGHSTALETTTTVGEEGCWLLQPPSMQLYSFSFIYWHEHVRSALSIFHLAAHGSYPSTGSKGTPAPQPTSLQQSPPGAKVLLPFPEPSSGCWSTCCTQYRCILFKLESVMYSLVTPLVFSRHVQFCKLPCDQGALLG